MTEIMISLAAVVLLILVIGFFAMRFLRADDSDEFDDSPAERGAARGRGNNRGWDDDGRVIPLPGRAGPAGGGHPARRNHGYGDAEYTGRPSQPGNRNPARVPDRARDRDSGRDRNSRAYTDRRSSPQPDGGRPAGRGAAGPHGPWGISDAESTQMMSPGSRSGRPGRPAPADRAGTGDQGREPGRPAAASRQAAGARPPAGSRPAASSRQGRAKRELNGRDWDALSDVDYWAELASDKPLTTTAQPASPDQAAADRMVPPAAPSRRRDRSAAADALPGRDAPGRRAEPARGGDAAAALPPRRHAPSGQPSVPVLPGNPAQPGSPGGRADQGPLPGPADRPARRQHGQRDLPAAQYREGGMEALNRLGGPGAMTGGNIPGSERGRRPVPADDDPLTSPSFPAIRDHDSRSYRARARESAGDRPAAGYSPPGPQPAAPGYPAPAPGPASASRGRRARPEPADTAAGYRDYAGMPPAPVGNPYGSYVSPAHSGYPENQPARRHSRPSGRHQGGSESLPPPPARPDGSVLPPAPAAPPGNVVPIHAAPVATAPGPGGGAMPAVPYGQQAAAGYASDGYPYPGGPYDQPAYPATDTRGIQQDQNGYSTPDSGYGAGAYGGYPGY